MSFIDFTVVTDPQTMADNAIAAYAAILQANGFPGYIPNDGDGEIIALTVVAQMFGDITGQAAQVPSAVFRRFGVRLAGIPYANGSFATITTTWTLADTLGHTIEAGWYVTVADLGFYVQSDTVVSPGISTAVVVLVAVEIGTTYNNLISPIVPVDQIDWVLSIAAVTASSGGADAEDDPTYQDGLASELELQAPRPITASDYAQFVISPSAVNATGITVGRSTAIDGFDPGVFAFAATTHGTTSLTAVSSFAGVTPGSMIAGADIPAGTTVFSINPSGSSLILTNAATGSHTAQAMTSTGSYGNQREVSVFVTDAEGNALGGSSTTGTAGASALALQAWLESFREVNYIVNVLSPTYSTIYVTGQVKVLPGYDPGMTIANVQAALLAFLNPATWGIPPNSRGVNAQWLNSTDGFATVRYNALIGVMESVAGAQYVPSGSSGLAIGLSASPTGVVDIALPGPAPLVTATSATILVTAA